MCSIKKRRRKSVFSYVLWKFFLYTQVCLLSILLTGLELKTAPTMLASPSPARPRKNMSVFLSMHTYVYCTVLYGMSIFDYSLLKTHKKATFLLNDFRLINDGDVCIERPNFFVCCHLSGSLLRPPTHAGQVS